MFKRLWKGWQRAQKPEPPELVAAREEARKVRIKLIQTTMRQQRVAYDVRQELAKVALEAVARG